MNEKLTFQEFLENSDTWEIISERELEDAYDELLDELYEQGNNNGIFAGMEGNVILKEVNPIAYRVGFSEFAADYEELENDTYLTREDYSLAESEFEEYTELYERAEGGDKEAEEELKVYE
jgi:hypothetical protein